uniref:ATP-dependent Clp protease ATP-binding subunit ClpX n=1 Tax=Lygus hesperus TaxID=30085 RepID=A0A0A9Y2E9_LYGHE
MAIPQQEAEQTPFAPSLLPPPAVSTSTTRTDTYNHSGKKDVQMQNVCAYKALNDTQLPSAEYEQYNNEICINDSNRNVLLPIVNGKDAVEDAVAKSDKEAKTEALKYAHMRDSCKNKNEMDECGIVSMCCLLLNRELEQLTYYTVREDMLTQHTQLQVSALV